MGIEHGNKLIVTRGLLFCLDVANPKSYPGTGTTWTDMIGGLSGSISGATYNSDNGGSMIFDGTNDVVTFGSDGAAVINGLTQLTLEMWFKSDVTSTNRGLIFGSNTSNDKDAGFSLRYDSSGVASSNMIKSAFGKNDDESVTYSPTWAEGQSNKQTTDWSNVMVTCDLSDSITFYINGGSSPPAFIYKGLQETVASCDNLVIGRGPKTDNLWDGKISVVRIYNRILSAAEALQNYNSVKWRYGL